MTVQAESAATALVAALVAFVAAAKGVALELFGVPLPVVLAAATGAFAARTFLQPTTYVRALGAGFVWTLIGVFGSSLVLSLLAGWTGKEIPAPALAGAALALALGGQLFWPVIVSRAPSALERLIERIGVQKS